MAVGSLLVWSLLVIATASAAGVYERRKYSVPSSYPPKPSPSPDVFVQMNLNC